ncbi:NADH-quinone oxidoreductase subunit L [soil metagenome]
MLELVWLIPALPLAGFLLLLVGGRRLGEPAAGWLATGVMGGSFLATVVVFIGLVGEPEEERRFVQTLFEWLPAGGFTVDVGFLVDPLSLTMALFVTGVGALIHLYSIGYMHGDPRYPAFFVYMNLFAFSMLMLVLGDNLLLTFLGWEGVGACSYFLISFWFSKDANASAGKKAFVTNRIGDWGFMVAMFLTFLSLGSLSYVDVLDGAGQLSAVTATAIAGLLFVGAVGKSAQIPLFVWLPDAMAGPTPVSALIHADTMVTSGIYLLVRVNPIIAESFTWLPTLIAVVGVTTAFFAATIALAQTDIKKVLAYSTVSQLGYMFLAVGVGAYIPAIFHMVTHAFFKALLFLGAGSVIHGMGDEQDMRRMGGLRKLMPITAVTFMVGWLAIAGVPPFSGFWSKDEILLYAYAESPLLWAVGLVTALLTAYYMSRQVFLVFFGKPRWEQAAVHTGAAVGGAAETERSSGADESRIGEAGAAEAAQSSRESTWTMTLPLVALAGLALVGGGLNLPFADGLHFLERWLEPVVGENEAHIDVALGVELVLVALSVLAAVGGIVIAAGIYLQRRLDPARVEPELLARGWRFDETVSAFMAGPGRRLFDASAWIVDRKVIDGAVNGVGALVRAGGTRLRPLQSGFVRSYAVGVAAGALVVVALFLSRATF